MGHDFKEGQLLWCGDIHCKLPPVNGYRIRLINSDGLLHVSRDLEEHEVSPESMRGKYRPDLQFGITEKYVVEKMAVTRHAMKVRDADRLTIEEVEYELSFWTQQLRRRSQSKETS